MAEGQILFSEDNLEEGQKGKYMTFKTGNEYFGIAINYVCEIIGIQPITAVPEVESYIKGLINLRGKIIPVIDMRARFNIEPLEYTDRTCIIVIDVKGTTVGLIIEKIAEVVTIDDEDIIPPPSLTHRNTSNNKYVYGIGKIGDQVKMLLDPEKLIKDEDMSIMGSLADDDADANEE